MICGLSAAFLWQRYPMKGRPAITQARFDVHRENDPPKAGIGIDEY
jgi:hypothetical protein